MKTEMPEGIVANLKLMMTGDVDGMRADIAPKKIARVPIAAIEIGDRKRRPATADVERIYHDIAGQGLLQPIGVKELGYSRYKLLYGYHRLEAFHMGLKAADGAAVVDWETIPAVIYDMEMPAWAAELKEISENLHRKNLTQSELEEHRARYIAILKRNNLTIDSAKPGKKTNNNIDVPEVHQLPSSREKAKQQFLVTDKTITTDFDHISKRAKTVAKAEGLPEPKPIKPTSSADDIDKSVRLSQRHTTARNEAREKGQNPNKVMPIDPTPAHMITVRINTQDPKPLIEWFKDSIGSETKPISPTYIRKLAKGLLKLVGE